MRGGKAFKRKANAGCRADERSSSMKMLRSFETWISEKRWRIYLMCLLLTGLPIGLFAYASSRMLRIQAERQSFAESSQIAHISASLVAEHFR